MPESGVKTLAQKADRARTGSFFSRSFLVWEQWIAIAAARAAQRVGKEDPDDGAPEVRRHAVCY
jgi:hypothetical protein